MSTGTTGVSKDGSSCGQCIAAQDSEFTMDTMVQVLTLRPGALQCEHAEVMETTEMQMSQGRQRPVRNPANRGIVAYVADIHQALKGPPLHEGEVWHLPPEEARNFRPAALALHANGLSIRPHGMGIQPITLSWSPFSMVQACRLHDEKADASRPWMRLFKVSIFHHGVTHLFACQGKAADSLRARWVADIACALRVLTQSLFPLYDIETEPVPGAVWTSTRLLAGFMLMCDSQGVSLVFCELHAHWDSVAAFVAYEDDCCDARVLHIPMTVQTAISERVGVDCGCFIIDAHHFAARSSSEKAMWLRAISNVKVKLRHTSANPTPDELVTYRKAIQESAKRIQSPGEHSGFTQIPLLPVRKVSQALDEDMQATLWQQQDRRQHAQVAEPRVAAPVMPRVEEPREQGTLANAPETKPSSLGTGTMGPLLSRPHFPILFGLADGTPEKTAKIGQGSPRAAKERPGPNITIPPLIEPSNAESKYAGSAGQPVEQEFSGTPESVPDSDGTVNDGTDTPGNPWSPPSRGVEVPREGSRPDSRSSGGGGGDATASQHRDLMAKAPSEKPKSPPRGSVDRPKSMRMANSDGADDSTNALPMAGSPMLLAHRRYTAHGSQGLGGQGLPPRPASFGDAEEAELTRPLPSRPAAMNEAPAEATAFQAPQTLETSLPQRKAGPPVNFARGGLSPHLQLPTDPVPMPSVQAGPGILAPEQFQGENDGQQQLPHPSGGFSGMLQRDSSSSSSPVAGQGVCPRKPAAMPLDATLELASGNQRPGLPEPSPEPLLALDWTLPQYLRAASSDFGPAAERRHRPLLPKGTPASEDVSPTASLLMGSARSPSQVTNHMAGIFLPPATANPGRFYSQKAAPYGGTGLAAGSNGPKKPKAFSACVADQVPLWQAGADPPPPSPPMSIFDRSAESDPETPSEKPSAVQSGTQAHPTPSSLPAAAPPELSPPPMRLLESAGPSRTTVESLGLQPTAPPRQPETESLPPPNEQLSSLPGKDLRPALMPEIAVQEPAGRPIVSHAPLRERTADRHAMDAFLRWVAAWCQTPASAAAAPNSR
eukprot:TRINITY_DN2492_c0_g2_i1.p1 TRINITY_DN2492_c0_g2~~TRINITY_DN2492_c0_g2_i1.p1  ORF type:complete len:1057 (+),score=227.50 TRINITY_DN2492_c0_g2_i1:110-3280(+)